jgi:hypothetical protein
MSTFRQFYNKTASDSGFTFYINRAFMCIDDKFDDAQAQAAAFG